MISVLLLTIIAPPMINILNTGASAADSGKRSLTAENITVHAWVCVHLPLHGRAIPNIHEHESFRTNGHSHNGEEIKTQGMAQHKRPSSISPHWSQIPIEERKSRWVLKGCGTSEEESTRVSSGSWTQKPEAVPRQPSQYARSR